MMVSGAPYRVTAAPLPLESSVWMDDEILRPLLPAQVIDTPTEAVKVSVTWPGATNAAAAKGTATEAPAVVITDEGTAKLAEALEPEVCDELCRLKTLKADGPVGSDDRATETVIVLAEPV